jgi:exodeoxyribonuclease VII large subunit
MVSPERARLLDAVHALAARLGASARHEIESRVLHVDHLARRLIHPGARLQAQGELLRQLEARLGQVLARAVAERQWRIGALLQRSRARLPNFAELSARSAQAMSRMRGAARARIERARADCARLEASLSHLDPGAVLERGYSIVQKLDGNVVRDSASLAIEEPVVLRFARGRARARIAAKD